MISEHDLHLMRHTMADNLGDLCSVQIYTDVVDGAGGMTRSWSNAYTNVPCRLAPQTKTVQTTGDQYQAVTGWVLTLRYDQAIAAGDRVVKASDTFDVLAVEDDRTGRVCRRAYLRRADG